jgi:hypothetical protein
MQPIDAPHNIAEAIAQLEADLARIRTEWPDFKMNEPFVRGDESLLDALVLFMADCPDVEAEKQSLVCFSADGLSILGVWLSTKKALAATAAALAAFCRLRKCSITISVKGVKITAEAPTAAELERILKVTDQLFIHPKDDGKDDNA